MRNLFRFENEGWSEAGALKGVTKVAILIRGVSNWQREVSFEADSSFPRGPECGAEDVKVWREVLRDMVSVPILPGKRENGEDSSELSRDWAYLRKVGRVMEGRSMDGKGFLSESQREKKLKTCDEIFKFQFVDRFLKSFEQPPPSPLRHLPLTSQELGRLGVLTYFAFQINAILRGLNCSTLSPATLIRRQDDCFVSLQLLNELDQIALSFAKLTKVRDMLQNLEDFSLFSDLPKAERNSCKLWRDQYLTTLSEGASTTAAASTAQLSAASTAQVSTVGADDSSTSPPTDSQIPYSTPSEEFKSIIKFFQCAVKASKEEADCIAQFTKRWRTIFNNWQMPSSLTALPDIHILHQAGLANITCFPSPFKVSVPPYETTNQH